MSKIIIDFWGDVNCPFCYLGDLALQKAIESSVYKDSIRVYFHACQLHPELNSNEAINFKEMLSRSVESEQVEKKLSIMAAKASQLGSECHIQSAWVTQSRDALRLLKWISDKSQGSPDQVLSLMKAFGKAFFVENLQLNQYKVLLSCIKELGMDTDEAQKILTSDLYKDAIDKDQKMAEEKCPEYIPSLYFNDKNRLDGVLKTEDILARINDTHAASMNEDCSGTVNMMGLDSCGNTCDSSSN